MVYEYHSNENMILSWFQLFIRQRTGATYLVFRLGGLRRISSNWIFVVVKEGVP